MKKFFTIFLCVAGIDFANAKEEYPNISGQVLFEARADRILSSKKTGVKSNAGYINIEPDFALNINENWAIKTGWRMLPIRQRRYDYPERSRTILGDEEGVSRGFNQDDTGVVVEEIKIAFENEDMKFAAGKFNPSFATLYRRNKRIGLFVTDFTEDYEIREKIGATASAILENSEISVSTFFADATGLSDSAITHRKKQNRNDDLASNNGTLSSYTITMEGEKLFGVKDLFYNFGYRSLDVDNSAQNAGAETGFTANLEYLYKMSRNTSIIPVIEYVRLKNFTGRKGRDANYLTAALIGKYSSWTASFASVFRNNKNNYPSAAVAKNNDKLYQLSVSYKFRNNISLDISRADIKEDGFKATSLGFIASYLYEF
jgi:hypothetical protein